MTACVASAAAVSMYHKPRVLPSMDTTRARASSEKARHKTRQVLEMTQDRAGSPPRPLKSETWIAEDAQPAFSGTLLLPLSCLHVRLGALLIMNAVGKVLPTMRVQIRVGSTYYHG